MAIDPSTEVLRPFAEASRRLPALRGGRPVHPTTLWRWAARGVRGRDGVTVRLESIKVGGTCCTSDEALLRFIHALSADSRQSPAAAHPPGCADNPGPGHEPDLTEDRGRSQPALP
jgi:hypothetical protein